MMWLILTIECLVAIKIVSLQEIPDINDDPMIFTSRSLPVNTLMGSIGNGYLATNVYSDTIFMSGVFNGKGGLSHRARIPSPANIEISNTDKETETFSLDTRQGVFINSFTTKTMQIEYRIYAHRFFTRTIINQIVATPSTGDEEIQLSLNQNLGPESLDFDLNPIETINIGDQEYFYRSGHTKVKEYDKYQANLTSIHIIYSKVPNMLNISASGGKFYFITTIDQDYNTAVEEINKVALLENQSSEELFENHTKIWMKLWEDGNINTEGNLDLNKAIHGSLYYLLSSLLSEKTYIKEFESFSFSPGSLARGSILKDYEGHSFWDTETWMFPPILLLYPQMARRLLTYRQHKIQAALDNAKEHGFNGAKFPWESAATGYETVQPCCLEVGQYEHHITGCIAYAARQYISMVNDDWLTNDNSVTGVKLDISGKDLIHKMAEFWASRVNYNSSTGFYDINAVMPPDEDHSNVNNSAFTNVVAGYSIYLAEYSSCLTGNKSQEEEAKQWSDIAKRLKLPFDDTINYHPEYDGYTTGTEIKQADVILLGYPILYPMAESLRKNDLDIYENVTRASGPAMTWSMHAIGRMELNNWLAAEKLFNMSYQPYLRQPFKIWTEEASPNQGAVNFITGMGGFLQAILSGYLGVRIRLQQLDFTPNLPPGTNNFTVSGLNYLGNSLSVIVQADTTTITLMQSSEENPLQLNENGNITFLKQGITVNVKTNSTFSIASTVVPSCPLPPDTIGHKKLLEETVPVKLL